MIMSLIAGELLKMGFHNLKELRLEDVERIGKALGLTKSASVFPGLGLLGVGIALGAGIGLLTATQPGKELRARLTSNLRARLERAKAERSGGGIRRENLHSSGMAAG
jgi:hypothetical protein